jgi:HlyD family secretion protein
MSALLRSKSLWLALLVGFLVMFWWNRRAQGPEVPVEPVTAGALLANVVATGRVATPSRVVVGTEIVGTLLSREVEPGDRVEAGQRIARLRAEEAEARLAEAEAALAQLVQRTRPEAQAQLADARARHAQAKREWVRLAGLAAKQLVATERAEQAAEALAIAEAGLRRAEVIASAVASTGSDTRLLEARAASARATLARSEIRSAVAGTVLRRLAEPGEVLSAGRGIIELAREGATEVVAQVDERNLDRLALGQSALVSADAYPEQRLAATVSEIAPAVDVQTGTVEIRLTMSDAPVTLKQDMTVSIDIEVGRRERALSVPNEVLRGRRGDRAEVHLLRDGGIEVRTVQLGLIGLERSEVLSGLAEGDLTLPASLALEPGSRARALPRQD